MKHAIFFGGCFAMLFGGVIIAIHIHVYIGLIMMGLFGYKFLKYLS